MAEPGLRHWAAGEAEIVEAGRELDVYTAPAFRSLVADLITHHARFRFVVSLENTEFVDPTGLAVLFGALQRARAHDGWLSVACTHEAVLRMFRIIGVTRLLDVHDTVEAALEAHGITGGTEDGR